MLLLPKKRWVLLTYLAILFVFVIPSQMVWAKTQRMGIPKGSYSLAPNSSKQVNSYCMDHSRPAPSSKDTQNHLLSGDAKVSFEGKTLSLQEAIDKEILTIRGTGYYGELGLVNHTDKPVEVDFTSSVILGSQKQAVDDLDPTLIKIAENPAQQKQIQELIWQQERKKRQRQTLKKLGYLDEDFPMDGKGTETLNKAIKKFQETYGLRPDDVVSLDRKLEEVARTGKYLQKINQQNPDILFLTVEHPVGRASEYIITSSEGLLLYKGSDISALVTKMNSRLSESHPTPAAIYFNFSRFSPNKAEAFERSYRIQQKGQNSTTNIPVKALPKERKFQNLRFSNQTRILSKQQDITITRVSSGSFKGWFKTQVEFTVTVAGKLHKIVLVIYGQTKEAVEKTVQVLYKAGPNLSLAMRTAKVYQELAQNTHGYVLTAQSLKQLGKTGIPMKTLNKLGSLKDKTFESSMEFKKTVKEAIGDDPNLDKIINYGEIQPEDFIRFDFQLESKHIDLGHLFRWLWVGYQFS